MTNDSLYVRRNEAENVRRNYSKTLVELQQDKNLSDLGRRRHIAELWRETRTQLDKLRSQEKELLDARWSQLEREVFSSRGAGISADPDTRAISARDAGDRAAQVRTPTAASALLRRAEADRDELLARAVARHAMDMSEQDVNKPNAAEWEAVTRHFIGARPHLESVVEELAEIERMSTRQILSPYSLPKPTDVTDQDINTAGAEAN